MRKKIIIFTLLFSLITTIFYHDTNVKSASNTDIKTDLAWCTTVCKAKSTWGNTTTSPVCEGNFIFVACDNYLYKLDKSNGEIVSEVLLEANIGYSYSITIGDNTVFIPLITGQVQAVSSITMEKLWITQKYDNYQCNTNVIYDNVNKQIFVAITAENYDEDMKSNGSIGKICCYSTQNFVQQNHNKMNQPLWTTINYQGHYWSTPIIFNNLLLIGSQAGNILVYDTHNGSLLSTTKLSGAIKAGITFDKNSDSFFTTTTDGKLWRFELLDGKITNKSSTQIVSKEYTYTNFTCTPKIYNQHIYVYGAYGDKTYNTIGIICTFSTDFTKESETTTNAEIKSCPYVETINETDYAFFTQNDEHGALYVNTSNGQYENLFTPDIDYQQYCCSNVICDADMLFYSNDSGTIFALTKKISTRETSTPSFPTTSHPPLFTSSLEETKSISNNKILNRVKISKISLVKKKRRKTLVKLFWKRSKGATHYDIHIKKKGQKRYKKILTTKQKKASFFLKKGHYYIRIRAYNKEKKLYSNLSKRQKVKIP